MRVILVQPFFRLGRSSFRGGACGEWGGVDVMKDSLRVRWFLTVANSQVGGGVVGEIALS